MQCVAHVKYVDYIQSTSSKQNINSGVARGGARRFRPVAQRRKEPVAKKRKLSYI